MNKSNTGKKTETTASAADAVVAAVNAKNKTAETSSHSTTMTTDKATEAIGDLLEKALSKDIVIKEKEERIITGDDFHAVVGSLATTFQTTPEVAMIGLFSTLQAGGTSKSKKSNVRITVQGMTFESKIINAAITKRLKKITPRQFARFFANQIFQISKRHSITGNAYVYIKRHLGQYLTETVPHEDIWAADFQIDNPACPLHIREALRLRYEAKFVKKTTN